MSTTIPRFPNSLAAGLALVGLSLMVAPSAEGGHPKRAQALVPVFAQQAPPVMYYSAPLATTYAPQAPLASPIYSAPAPLYSAPSPVAYQFQQAPVQPLQYQPSVGNAPAVVGNAPTAIVGSKVSAVDRADIIEELRTEYKEADKTTSRRERRKALKETATTKFKEAIGDDAELGDADTQDVDNIVNSIIDGPESTQVANKPAVGADNPGYSYGYQPQAMTYGSLYSAPATRFVPVAGAPLIQPVVPVQFWMPVQQKHKFLHSH
jgi:hypothetical protein